MDSLVSTSDGGVVAAGYLLGKATLGGTEVDFGLEGGLLMKVDAQGKVVWTVATRGGAQGSNQRSHFESVAVDAQGNVVAAGWVIDEVSLAGTPIKAAGWGALILKIDPTGKVLWTKLLDGPGDDQASGVTIDAQGNILVAGDSSGTLDLGGGETTAIGTYDLFTVRLDADGTPLSAGRFGAPGKSLRVPSLSGDGTRACLSVVSFSGPAEVSFGATKASGDLFLMRLDASGTPLWSKGFGTNVGANIVSCPDAQHIALGGTFQGGSLDFGGKVLTMKDSLLAANMFVASFDGDGNHIWSNAPQGEGLTGLRALHVDTTGRITATGAFEGMLDLASPSGPMTSAGKLDVFVAQFAADGQTLSTRSLGGPGLDAGISLAVGASGVVVGGNGGTVSKDPSGGLVFADSGTSSSAFLVSLP